MIPEHLTSLAKGILDGDDGLIPILQDALIEHNMPECARHFGTPAHDGRPASVCTVLQSLALLEIKTEFVGYIGTHNDWDKIHEEMSGLFERYSKKALPDSHEKETSK